MDLFLAHSLALLWTSFLAARYLASRTGDRIMVAALLGWGNLVVSSLLLSGLHRLGEPRWFFGTSLLLALAGILLGWKIRPVPANGQTAPVSRPAHPGLVLGLTLTLILVAGLNLRLAWTFSPGDDASLSYQLPRGLYYLGQNSLGHFDASDSRQVCLPFNFNLLQLFGLIYHAPLQCLNIINLAAWAVAGLAVYRLCRLGNLGANPALVAPGLAVGVSLGLAPAVVLAADLPAVAGLLCAFVFFFRWKESRQLRDALLAGLAAGLAAGSEIALLGLVPAAGLIALTAGLRHGGPSALAASLRTWCAPLLLALLLATPFAFITLAATGHWLQPGESLPWFSVPRSSPPAALPLLIKYRLADATRINVDTDGSDERIFPLMTLGSAQRFTSRHKIDPDAYNLLSRAGRSRQGAYQNPERLPSYSLLAIPAKRTAGVEFLGRVGAGPTARDYFGLEAHAGQTAPINSNRSVLITLYHETAGSDPTAHPRVTIAGLNPEDHLEVVVSLELEDKSVVPLATLKSDGATTVAITQPFAWLVCRAFDATTHVEMGATAIPCQPQAVATREPVDPALPTSATSLFVTDLVLASKSGLVTAAGLLPVEGPFPQWDLPFIRWQRQPASTIRISPVAQLARLQVSFSARLHVRNQGALDVFFNGQLVQRYRFEGRTTWLDQTLALTPRPGENVLEFKDAPLLNEPQWLAYLELYPDVMKHVVTNHLPLEQGAREHYEQHGRAEGRTLPLREKPEPAPDSYYFMYRNLRLEGFKSP